MFLLSFNHSRGKLSKNYAIKLVEKVKPLLARTTILNGDYKLVIQKYDFSTTFFYFDPPYVSKFKLYKHNDIDYKEMKTILDGIKGYWALSINDTPYFRTLFKGYHFTKIPTRYIISKTDNHSGFDLLIRNFS